MPLGEIRQDGDYTYYRCSSCGVEHTTRARAQRCCMHGCTNCGALYLSQHDATTCCPQFPCESCGARYYYQDEARDCCGTEDEYEDGEDTAIDDEFIVEEATEYRSTRPALYPPDVIEVEPEHILYIEPIEGRTARPCSIEQELTAGGRPVAAMLYELGFSDYDQICNYSRDSYPSRMIVKEDGSLPGGGGEVLYSRYNLGLSAHTHDVSKALACIDELRRRDIVSVGQTAGIHVHMGALDHDNENLIGPPQMASLYEIFSFAEDVLFRLAASGWSEHRGLSYTMPLVKMDRVSPGKIAQETQGSRHFSLSFTRLLNAARNCTCGACIAGDWSECICGSLANGTIEWRIFNSATDPKTIHAWTLLAHGLTAASLTHELGSLEPNSFEWSHDPRERHAWVFGWILQNCPFTDPERQLIVECARMSPKLHIDWDEFDRDHGGWGQLRLPSAPSAAERAARPFDPTRAPRPPRPPRLRGRLETMAAGIDWGQVASGATTWTQHMTATQEQSEDTFRAMQQAMESMQATRFRIGPTTEPEPEEDSSDPPF